VVEAKAKAKAAAKVAKKAAQVEAKVAKKAAQVEAKAAKKQAANLKKVLEFCVKNGITKQELLAELQR
jgi:hypothetical protein